MTAATGAASPPLDRDRLRRLVVFVVALAALWSLLLLGAVLLWSGDALGASMATIDTRIVVCVVATFVVNHALRFTRWHLMLRAEKHFVPWRRSLAIFLAGLALLPTPAKAGVTVRSVMLLDAGVPVHVSLAAYFVERLLDFIGLVMLASLLVDAGVAGNRWLPGLAIGVGAIAAILVARPACRALRPLIGGSPMLLRAVDWVLNFLQDAAHMLGGWRLPAFLLLGMAANAATGLLLWIALGGAGGPIDLAYAMATIGVAHVSGSITLLPGGIGGFELAMMGMLSSAGVAAGAVVTGIAVVRVITLWGSVLVGLPLLYVQMRRGSPVVSSGEERSPVEFPAVRHEERSLAARVGDLAWLAIPFLAYLVLLSRLWFNVPVDDDYQAVLESTLRLFDAPTPGEWLQALLRQHNEHRIVVTRLIALAMAGLAGHIDFRVLMLIGNLGLAAILFQLWVEFRDRAAAPLVAAAGFLLCQVSHYEGSLVSMAAIQNIGVLAFALACFQLALRPGRWSLALAAAFGFAAAFTAANGLFALPLAVAACALRGERRRARILLVAAVLAWSLYLFNYASPYNHASPFEVLRHKLDAAHLFLVIVGSFALDVLPATILGALLLAAFSRLALAGFWRQRPAIALWVVFILLSIATIAIGRVTIGVIWTSRYAINSSCLVAVLLLLIATRRERPGRQAVAVFVAAAIVSLGVSWSIWPHAAAYAFRGRLLAKPISDPPLSVTEPYFGVIFPIPWANLVLAQAEARGLYTVRGVAVFAAELRTSKSPPRPRRLVGALDKVDVVGTRVIASGWTDLNATMPGRVFTAHAPETPRATSLTLAPRIDVVTYFFRDPTLLFSGFRWEGDYESAEQARRAAASLCLLVEAPGHGPTALPGNNNCGPVSPEGSP